MEAKVVYEFGDYLLDPNERLLLRGGVPVSVAPQLFSLLLALVENSGHLLTKEEIRQRLWVGTTVGDQNLKVTIGSLRKVLGEGINGTEYIKTVHRQGYRFVAAVKKSEVGQQSIQVIENRQRPTLAEPSPSHLPIKGSMVADAPTAANNKITQKANTISRGLLIRGLLAVLVLGAIYGAWLSTVTRPKTDQTMMPLVKRKSLAVVGFKNLSGKKDEDWLSTALVEMLSTEFASAQTLRTIAPEQVARAIRELNLGPDGTLTQDALEKLHRNLGVDFVIMGSYTVLAEGEIRLDARVQDLRTGETAAWKSIQGDEKQLFRLVTEAGSQLKNALGVSGLASDRADALRRVFPSSLEAGQFYSQGLERLRSSDSLAARSLFQRALAYEPDHPLLHSTLAAALSNLGYEALSKEESKTALLLGKNLPLEERLLIEGQYRQSTKEWNKAIEVYQTLFKYVPDRLEYGLELAKTQALASRGQDALATISALRADKSYPDDGRVDLAEANAKLSVSDLKGAQQAARAASRKAAARGARFLVADSLLAEADADRNLGEIPEAVSSLERARQIYITVGDDIGIGRTLVIHASAIRDAEHVLIRKKMYEDAIIVFNRVGDKSDKARALNALGGVYEDLGDLQKSKSTYEESLAIYREIGNEGWAAVVINNIGTVYGVQGDLIHAKQMYEQALALFEKTGGKAGIGLSTANIAGILQRQGELDSAQALFERALGIYRELGGKPSVAGLLTNLGDINFIRGDLLSSLDLYKQAVSVSEMVPNKTLRAEILTKLARVYSEQANSTESQKLYAEAVDLTRDIGSGPITAEINLAGAELYLNEGKYREAEQKAGNAALNFTSQAKTDSLLKAKDLIAQSMLGENNCAAAEKIIEDSAHLLKKTRDPSIYLPFTITAGRIQATCNHSVSEARNAVTQALAEANRRRMVRIVLYGKIALAEIAMREGKSGAASSILNGVAKDAESQGFLLLSVRAQTHGRPVPRSRP
jgi:DNA-binding winged helix-turn-helix (wHTH) protein/tetratricopeptide (TPR) repeat protein